MPYLPLPIDSCATSCVDGTFCLRNPQGDWLSAFGDDYLANLRHDAREFDSRAEAQQAADALNEEIENEDDHFFVVEV